MYVAAIAAHHDAVDGRSLGKHDLIVKFLKGARRTNPSRSPLCALLGPLYQVNPLCRHDITSPFPPSGNGGYVRNLDVSLSSNSRQLFFKGSMNTNTGRNDLYPNKVSLQVHVANYFPTKHHRNLLLQNNVVRIFCLVEIFCLDQARLQGRDKL